MNKESTNTLILIANICVLGLTVKLYTEIFKDKAFDKRAKKPLPEERAKSAYPPDDTVKIELGES